MEGFAANIQVIAIGCVGSAGMSTDNDAVRTDGIDVLALDRTLNKCLTEIDCNG